MCERDIVKGIAVIEVAVGDDVVCAGIAVFAEFDLEAAAHGLAGGFEDTGDIDMRRGLIDAVIGGVSVVGSSGDPWGPVITADQDLVAGQAEIDALVVIVEIEP